MANVEARHYEQAIAEAREEAQANPNKVFGHYVNNLGIWLLARAHELAKQEAQ